MTTVCINVEIDLTEVATANIRREAVARGLLAANEDDDSRSRCFFIDASVDLDDIDDADIAKEYVDRGLDKGPLSVTEELNDIKALFRQRRPAATAEAIIHLERLLDVDVFSLLAPA